MKLKEYKKQQRLPEEGTKVRIGKRLTKDTEGWLVKDKNLITRKPGAHGIYIGWVPGAGGDLWWIQHEDGTVGAYLYKECFDL